MSKLIFLTTCSLVIAVTCITGTYTSSIASVESKTLHIDLAVSFEVKNRLLWGTAKIRIPQDQDVKFYTAGLVMTAAFMNYPGQENLPVAMNQDKFLYIPASNNDRTLLLSYEKSIENGFQNLITKEAIVLTSSWHPIPDQKATYTLSAKVPAGFKAISESDVFVKTTPEGLAEFTFSQPVHALTFAAAPYVETSKLVRSGLRVYTLFFVEDQALAEAYLDSAADYITRYEDSIGPFPYNHYAIVENINPTGYGLPTFTLLGKQVIRLPFIRQTSLGHEILHSWFGNSVDVAFSSGNWSEGLTTYLADMAYRADAGEGAAARKEAILSYLSYVDDTAAPLEEFIAAGHNSVSNRPSRAVGYQRAAMLFHELYSRLGKESFWRVIRRLYAEFKGTSASWNDLQNLFEEESSEDLKHFFQQHLTRTELPSLTLNNLKTRNTPKATKLSFTLEQQTTEPFELLVPLAVNTVTGRQDFSRLINRSKTDITLELDSLPVELIVDPHLDIMRSLNHDERYPVWAELMGAKDTLVIMGDESQTAIYEPFLNLASRYSWKITKAADLTQQDIIGNSLIFLGIDGPVSRTIVAKPNHPENGFTLELRFNPFNQNKLIALLSSSERKETEAVVRRLDHYGKYSYLHFLSGRLIDKKTVPADYGIRASIEPKPSGFALSELNDFDTLVNQLSNYRVVYIGETHTSRADHLLQLMLIEALHQKYPDMAIGMEMFPQSSQKALNNYINKTTENESQFLRDSRYYDVWRYDYRLFRPIFAYARKHQIPVIGLNIDREIVNQVFTSGGTDTLTSEQLRVLPTDRELDLPGYVERLKESHEMHAGQVHTAGSLSGFIQAQSLWDETMAESISTFLTENPSSRMVVLAGSQHTRKDSGIPPRVARRIPVTQAIVGNLATSSLVGKELSETTDFLFFLETNDFAPQGKIGIVLIEKEHEGAQEMEIIEVNPLSDAARSGIESGDILVRIEDQAVSNMDDIKGALMNKLVGDTVSIVVKRPLKNNGREERILDVILIDPENIKPHP